MKWIIILALLFIGCEEVDMHGGKEYGVELVASNVVETAPSITTFVCGTSADGVYLGSAGNELAPDPKKLYDVKVETKEYVANNKYLYKLDIGEIVEDGGEYYRVLKPISLAYGAPQDNATYNTIVDTTTTTTWTVDGVDWEEETPICGVVDDMFADFTVTRNNASGTMKEVSRHETIESVVSRSIRKAMVKKVTNPENELPAVGDEIKECGKKLVYVAPPSLPPKTDTTYWEKLPKAECTAEYRRMAEPYLPFDSRSVTRAISPSPMTYTGRILTESNAFVLSGVIAESLTYRVTKADGTGIIPSTTIEMSQNIGGNFFTLGECTKIIPFGSVLPAGTLIEITLSNSKGDVELGTFSTVGYEDYGATETDVDFKRKDYNTYTADAWGQIEEGSKPKVRQVSLSVTSDYQTVAKLFARTSLIEGKIGVYDITDSIIAKDEWTLSQLGVLRGIVKVSGWKIARDKDGTPKDAQTLPLTILEVI